MQRAETLTREQIRQFLKASQEARLQALDREELYGWVEATLRAQQHEKQPRAVRGLLLQYLVKRTGRSEAQIDDSSGAFANRGK